MLRSTSPGCAERSFAALAGTRGGRRRRLARRGRWTPSIRTRVLAIALIPSAALLVTGASVAGYLISQGLSTRNFSAYLSQFTGPTVQVGADVTQERTESLLVLGGDHQALAGLQKQW